LKQGPGLMISEEVKTIRILKRGCFLSRRDI